MSVNEKSAQQGQYVEANGLRIYYEEYGSGEPLVLLHAGMCNLATWEQTPLLSQHFRVIAFDRRGHGRTKNPTDTLSFRTMADDTAAFIQALGLDRPVVCGYSDGGIIALTLAARYPKLAKAYVAGAAQYQFSRSYDEFVGAFCIEREGVVDFEKLERTQQAPQATRIVAQASRLCGQARRPAKAAASLRNATFRPRKALIIYRSSY
jgi:pimeloyl-ACP methyl ester carboxylesterase